MAIDFKKTQLSGHTPEIWRGECKILPGGFKPVQNFPVGTVLHRGTPIYVDFEAMSAAVCKTAKVLKGGTTTAPRVAKGHYFVAGDVVMKLGVTDKSPIIKSIDTANAEYDVLTFASAIAGLAEGDILILAGSIPSSLPQTTYERLLARLEGHGVHTVVDATRDLLVNVLQYHPFLIKPNDHELGEIVGRTLTTDADITAAARTLQEKGARNVLVSMAGDGALLLDEKGEVHRIGTPKGKVVNSVGAGDSMVAGFVAGYLRSGSYLEALRLGTACGSATAFSLGLAKKEKIDELLNQI